MDLYRIKKYCSDPSLLVRACDITIIDSSELFVETIFDILQKSERSIFLEFYEIADDSLGIKLQQILCQKASSGVDVYVIYDSIGSRNTSKEYFSVLKKNGVKVIEYNPIKLFTSVRKWFRRDHRKIIISDFSKAIIGGFNLSLDYAPYSIGGRNWKDIGISFSGEAVYEVTKIFRDNWIRCGGNYFDIPFSCRCGDVYVMLVYEFGITNIRSVRKAYRYAMDNAKDFIYIMNAYFLPDKQLARCLKRAVMRGVDVKIIVPHKTDHPYVRLASFTILKDLIKHGIKVYEWQKEILHAKSAVIDGVWVSLGSHNLDHISLHYNLELNINIYDEIIGAKMKENFEKDINNCTELTFDKIKKMPLSMKAISQFIYLFRDFL
ncbi:MAG: phosphatidylserine/phosphatidylglycerophosphate/cardiolipin synthase family protein [Elusimicrobiales bacterium]|nr:phosphatidylserine/phosphatidylglycerophosphate/cardiolipin synthase family protein [Elusimicrobiales bacterium]